MTGGCPAAYVKPLASLAVRSPIRTSTSTVPAVRAAVVALMVVALTTVTLVANAPPRVTTAGLENPVPVMVTAVPPWTGPLAGEIAVTVWAGGAGVVGLLLLHATVVTRPIRMRIRFIAPW
jgi:hypothetical protein